MRILKPPKAERPQIITKRMALAECKHCPSCNSTKVHPDWEYKELGTFYATDYEEIHAFWTKQSKRVEFTCDSCGCVYESDPFDFIAVPNKYLATLLIALGVCFFIFGMLAFGKDWERAIYHELANFICCAFCIVYAVLCLTRYKHHQIYEDFEPTEVAVSPKNKSIFAVLTTTDEDIIKSLNNIDHQIDDLEKSVDDEMLHF